LGFGGTVARGPRAALVAVLGVAGAAAVSLLATGALVGAT